jgi:hypothetical protein
MQLFTMELGYNKFRTGRYGLANEVWDWNSLGRRSLEEGQTGRIEMSMDTLNFDLLPKHRFVLCRNSAVQLTQLDDQKADSDADRAKIGSSRAAATKY